MTPCLSFRYRFNDAAPRPPDRSRHGCLARHRICQCVCARQGEAPHIVAVARTQGGLEELDDEIRKDGGSATLVPLSLTDFDGIARLGAALNERHGKLDILLGNAGIAGPSSPLGHIEMKPWNDVIAVNLSANFQMIRCMEPLLRRSDAGRAVFVTSGARGQGDCLSRPLCHFEGCARGTGAGMGA